MDKANKPRRYPAVRRSPAATPLNRRFSAFGNAPLEELPYTEKLVFAADQLAPAHPTKPDNLLLAAVKDAPIVLTVALPDNVEFTDTIEIEFFGVATGKEILLDPFLNPPTDITVTIAPEDHALQPEGKVEINYVMHFYSGGGGTQHGPAGQFYTTDYTKPGLPFLGQLVFSDDVNANGVTEAALLGTGADAYLPARVPGYTDLDSDGDTITGMVGNLQETVDAIQVQPGELELHFKRDFIVQLDDGALPFSYFVTDRAGNVSDPAEPVVLQVLLKDAIGDLSTPLVPAYDDDDESAGVAKLIDEADARAVGGLSVIIPANGNIKAGDTIMVAWGAVEVGQSSIADPAGDPLATIGVPYAAISDAWNTDSNGEDKVQTLDVTYHILRNGISAGTPVTPATVQVNLHQAGGEDLTPETPENENLGTPSLASASGQSNAIPPADFDKDATLTVPWFRTDDATIAAFVAGDVVTVRYGATDLAPRTITAQDVTDAINLTVTLPLATIGAEGSGPAVPLQFFVTRTLAAGGSNTSSSPIQPVKVSGPDELPGAGQPLVALNVPEAVGADPNPGNPDRLIIGRTQGKDGTDFVIPAYANQDPADAIVVNMLVFRSFYYPNHQQDIPANGDGARDLVIADIHPTDATSDTIVHVTEAQLMHYELPTQGLHGHITYTVVGAARPDNPVTSELRLLDIDPRGE